MSITDQNDNTTIRLPGVWETMFKIAISLAAPTFALGVSWAVWITHLSFDHERDIAVLQAGLMEMKAGQHGLSSQRGKLPSKVAAAVKPEEEEESTRN